MTLLTLPQWARMNGMSVARARQLAESGRIKDATKAGRYWIMPPSEHVRKPMGNFRKKE